jgi:hypothetical protein
VERLLYLAALQAQWCKALLLSSIKKAARRSPSVRQAPEMV